MHYHDMIKTLHTLHLTVLRNIGSKNYLKVDMDTAFTHSEDKTLISNLRQNKVGNSVDI